jgi:hypothetical protein
MYIEDFSLNPAMSVLLLFASLYQIAVKIKPLYLTHYAYYLTSNKNRVVQQQ